MDPLRARCERHGLHYDPSLAAGCIVCRREQHGDDVAGARRPLLLVLLALAVALGLVTPWLKSRPKLQTTREPGVTAITPIEVDSTLPEREDNGATAAPTALMNPTEHRATTGMAARVTDDVEGRVIVNTNTEEYTISGDTVPELLRSIGRAAPLGQGAQRHAGLTEWRVSYHWRYERNGQGCRTRPVSTEVNITYQIPHWANAPAAVLSLQTKWNGFIAALWVHEKGHAEHGIQAAHDIQTGLEGLPAEPDCEAASARATAVAQEILKRYADIDVDYDRQTEGGRTQGAWLEYR